MTIPFAAVRMLGPDRNHPSGVSQRRSPRAPSFAAADDAVPGAFASGLHNAEPRSGIIRVLNSPSRYHRGEADAEPPYNPATGQRPPRADQRWSRQAIERVAGQGSLVRGRRTMAVRARWSGVALTAD